MTEPLSEKILVEEAQKSNKLFPRKSPKNKFTEVSVQKIFEHL